MRSGSHTQQEILEIAESMLRSRGFNSFSYKDISSIMDIKNAAIHHYFPTKTGLSVQIVKQETGKIKRLRQTGIEGLKGLVTTFYHASMKSQICLTGSLTPDYTQLPEEMQAAVREMCLVTLKWVAGCLEMARSKRDMYFQGSADDRALLFLSTLLSSLLLSRVLGGHVFENMINQLLKDLGASWSTGDLPDLPIP